MLVTLLVILSLSACHQHNPYKEESQVNPYVNTDHRVSNVEHHDFHGSHTNLNTGYYESSTHQERTYMNGEKLNSSPAFFHYLAEGYSDLAQQENYEHHFKELDVFKSKSKNAKNGMQVQPHQVSQRKVPEWSINELKDARESLMTILTDRVQQQYPYLLAQSQVMFDCWLEEQEENINQHDINICRDSFYAAYNQIKLNLGNGSFKYKNETLTKRLPIRRRLEATPCNCEEIKTETPYMKPKSFILYFELDRDTLTSASIRMIKKIKNAASQFSPTKIIVQGHTDRAGKQFYNQALSQRRVLSVISGLIIAGLDNNIIKSGHFGEEQPKVMTKDGTVKAENRRVEVRFE